MKKSYCPTWRVAMLPGMRSNWEPVWGKAGLESDGAVVRELVFENFSSAVYSARQRLRRSVVFDVGTNDGEWSVRLCKHMKKARSLSPHAWLDLHFFEPQPQFVATLTNLTTSLPQTLHAPNMTVTFHPVAAWRANGTLPFYLSSFKSSGGGLRSMFSSIHQANARAAL